MSLSDRLDELILTGSNQELATFIRYLNDQPLDFDYEPLLKKALQRGQVERVVYLLHLLQYIPLTDKILQFAGQLRIRGSRYIIEKLVRLSESFRTIYWINVMAESAAFHPDLTSRTLYLLSHGADNLGEVLTQAVRGNNILLIRELFTRYGNRPVRLAAIKCDLSILRYIFERFTFTSDELESLKILIRRIIGASAAANEAQRCQQILDYLDTVTPEKEDEDEFLFYSPLDSN